MSIHVPSRGGGGERTRARANSLCCFYKVENKKPVALGGWGRGQESCLIWPS